MKQKIYVLIVMLVTILATVPRNIDVIATGEYGDPEIDYPWIYDKIENLSITGKNNERGRYFGTNGEREAADDIKGWMEDIGLDCVKKETIDKFWFPEDEKVKHLNESLFIGRLNKARVMKTYWIKITIYNKNPWSVVEYKNLSGTACFPSFQWMARPFWPYKEDKGSNITVKEDFPWVPGEGLEFLEPRMELGYTHWSKSYKLFNTSDEIYRNLFRYKGIIAIDNNTDTHFMPPPCCDLCFGNIIMNTQTFYVNGSIGAWIRNYLADKTTYKVKADFYTRWDWDIVTSYNVIGQINSTSNNKDPDPKNVSIIGAHYDCMWNQGTIDEGAETALVLGIAKYIKDHQLESKLKHTVKFIAFGGEEPGIRGAKDYIKEHVILPKKYPIIYGQPENITYVINPGNFGHYNRTGYNYTNVFFEIPFEFNSDKSWLADLANNTANALNYTPRTNETGPGFINTTTFTDFLRAEDSSIFGINKSGVANASIQFGRSPNEGYHRDGVNHTKGDVVDRLDNGTFGLESEVVTSVAMHLLLDPTFSLNNCTNTTFDKDNDSNIDSVKLIFNVTSDTNTSLFGNVTACLYNISTGAPASFINYSGFIPIIKGNTTTGFLNVTLLPNQSRDNYTARLVLKDVFNKTHGVCNQTVYLYPYGEPIAEFFWISNSKNVSFTNSSYSSPGATINNWTWNFGDGNYSYIPNPYHWYTNNGDYNVILTVNDTNGLNASVTNKIQVNGWTPTGSFSMSSNVACKSESITFTSTSSDSDGTIVGYSWDFGDGITNSGNVTSHSYTGSGVYTVTLVITDNDGETNTTTSTVYVAAAKVDDDFIDDSESHEWDSIQEGINDIKDDELLYVFNGDYNSGITVNKSISLYGQQNEDVIINISGTAINIVNNSALINGLTIKNATIGINLDGSSSCYISNCNIIDSNIGIKIEGNAEQNMINHCNLTNNSYGIYITGSNNNIIGSAMEGDSMWNNDSVFKLNDYAVYLENADDNFILGCNIDATQYDPCLPTSTWGVCLDNSDNNTVAFCDIYNASYYGIYLSGSDDNQVMNSFVRNNDKGVYLSSSSNNIIVGNDISCNSMSGVNILTLSCTSNYVLFNDFIRNGGGRYPQAEDYGSGNIWNTSDNDTFIYDSVGEGNYWDDYTGEDSDGNGIGDTSYSIPGTAGSEDFYPVMEAYNWLEEWF